MGPRSSKESQVNFMKDYDVIQTNPTQNITFLQHKKTQEQYLLKEFNFNDKKQCDKSMDKLSQLKTKLAGNKHVVPLKDYLMNSQDQYCSTFYKIYALFEYPQRTLDDEINERKLHRKRFTETQLWSILASCIVGLSHLQKNGIKHSSLKSNNILLSREGIIKISDPFAMGQQSNYDAALTKRNTLHAYLSPEQTQALQQQLITPTYNTYKSDIFTLGMIMLQAGLLEYQDEQCYRDQKTRIHWETVQYNIDRLGQAYSDQIKNMVEFMLSRDQRARPDWIDLEQYVMKNGDEVRRSMIQDQTKGENSFINSDVFHGASNNKPIGLNNKPNRNSDNVQFTNSPIAPNQQLQNNTPLYPMSPRIPVVPQQSLISPTVMYQQPFATNPIFTRYPRTESPRVPVTNPTLFQNNLHNTLLPAVGSSSYHNNSNYNSGIIGGANLTNLGMQTSQGIMQPLVSIPPLRPSIIDLTRPTRNIFPADTYITRTKFDENLIIMVEDEQEGEDNETDISHPFMQSNTVPPQIYSKPTNQMLGKFQGQANPRIMQSPTQAYEPMRYNNPYPLPEQANFSNVADLQNRVATQPRISQQQTEQIQVNNTNLQFVTQQFKMGSRYEGYKLNGLRHGYGKFYYQDGGMYDGDWKENKMEGFGKLYYQSGKLAYEGQWRNDQFMGKGILYNEVPQFLNHNFNYNNFDDVDQFWTKYQGQFSDDMKNGKGTLFLSNGEKFEGTFVADSVEGPGVFYCRNGSKINGVWRANVKQK